MTGISGITGKCHISAQAFDSGKPGDPDPGIAGPWATWPTKVTNVVANHNKHHKSPTLW